MNKLPNDCFYSNLFVQPENWKSLTTVKSLASNWFIQCYYYDPSRPKPFPYRIKLNRYKSLEKRKSAIRFLLKDIPYRLEVLGYNPITRTYIEEVPEPGANILTAKQAIWDAFNSKQLAATSRSVIKASLTRITTAMDQLDMAQLPITDFGRANIKLVLTHINPTPKQYNYFLACLSMMFGEIQEKEQVEFNPVKMLKPQKVTVAIKTVASITDIAALLDDLRGLDYNLFRYAMIFFLSGARGTEMFRVKIKTIQIELQEYKTTILKGTSAQDVVKIIFLEAVPYWEELIAESIDGEQYLFGPDLSPSFTPYDSRSMSTKWFQKVNVKLGFKGGIYPFKHRMLSLLENMVSFSASDFPSIMAGHKDKRTTSKHYLIDIKTKYNEALKKVKFGVFPPYEGRG